MWGLRVGTLSGCKTGAAGGYRVSCSTHPTADRKGDPIFWDVRFAINWFSNDFLLPAQGIFYPLDSPKHVDAGGFGIPSWKTPGRERKAPKS